MDLVISVALCTHNGGRFIREQIRSICLSDCAPAEIVISDDASTDQTVALAESAWRECLAERPGSTTELKMLLNPIPLGVTQNFERAVAACRGDLIALSDQDDVWVEGRLRRMVDEFAQRPDLLLLHSDASLVGAAREPLGLSLFDALEVTRHERTSIHEGRAFDVLLRRNLVTGATTVFRRSLLPKAMPFPRQWLHDEWLGVVAAAIGRVDVVEDQLIEYRQHGGNQIGARAEGFWLKVKKALAARGDTHFNRAIKAELLLNHLLSIEGVAAEKLEKIRGKLVHQRFRANLPDKRYRRIGPVLREARTGRYNKYGRGFRGIVRDLFEAV